MRLFVVGLFVGVVAGWFFGGLTDKFKAQLGDVGFINQVSPSQTPTPSKTPEFDLWQKIINEASFSTVSVQFFQNNILKKQGSGVILSSDGLVVTALDLAAESIVQILFDDKILKGLVVKKDPVNNLVLIKVNGGDFNVSSLDSPPSYESGQDIILTGKLSELGNVTTFSQRALISYVLNKKIVLDIQANNLINGSQVLNHKGEMIGVAYQKEGKVYLINSDIISIFYNTYLNK